MSKKTRDRLIIAGVAVVWAALAVLAYSAGEWRALFWVAVSTVVGLVVGLGIWRRQRRFDRQGVAGFAVVEDSAVYETDNPYRRVAQVAMSLRFDGVGVGVDGDRIYRIFNLPYDEHERYAAGARLPIRLLPNDLSVIQIEHGPVEPSAKRRYVEARVSQTPIEDFA
ncbi:hypothetical protein AB0H43_22375 [Hamadaea sp. NPDC050747]|uniref:hypothetical protein n=1 Tax=Hamadaea sp. NPDC050747 TaxID=3155789 RepID=UPI0033E4F2CE